MMSWKIFCCYLFSVLLICCTTQNFKEITSTNYSTTFVRHLTAWSFECTSMHTAFDADNQPCHTKPATFTFTMIGQWLRKLHCKFYLFLNNCQGVNISNDDITYLYYYFFFRFMKEHCIVSSLLNILLSVSLNMYIVFLILYSFYYYFQHTFLIQNTWHKTHKIQ